MNLNSFLRWHDTLHANATLRSFITWYNEVHGPEMGAVEDDDEDESIIMGILDGFLGNQNDDPLEEEIMSSLTAELESQANGKLADPVIDCSKYYAEKYADILTESEVRLYTDAFVAANADFCRFRWKQYFMDKGVSDRDFDLYYQGHGVFDWDTYNEEKDVAVVLTYKDFFLEENSELNITDEEYERFTHGLNFDWAGFWDSREPVIDINEMEFDPNAVTIDYNADGSINEPEYTDLNDLYR